MKILIENLAAIGVTIVKLMKLLDARLVSGSIDALLLRLPKIMEFANSYQKPSTCTVMRAMKILTRILKCHSFWHLETERLKGHPSLQALMGGLSSWSGRGLQMVFAIGFCQSLLQRCVQQKACCCRGCPTQFLSSSSLPKGV